MGLWKNITGAIRRAGQALSSTKAFGVAGVRSVLMGKLAGGWASDHRAESEKFSGWHYIAIHTIAMAAAQAEVVVYDDSDGVVESKRRKTRRKTLRSRYGSVTQWKALYGADDRETEPLPPTHPLVQLMQRPNPVQSGAEFRYEIAQQLRLTGSAYIWNVPNRMGRVCERYVIPQAMCQPWPPSRDMPNGGWRVDPAISRYRPATVDGFTEVTGWARAAGAVIPAEQMQIIRLPHPIYKDDGQSPLSAAALWADTADMVDQARFYHMLNGPDPSLVVTPGKETSPSEEDLERARAKLEKQWCGPKNTKKVIVAAPETIITDVGTTPKDMSYETGWEQLKAANLAVHQVPPVAAGLQEAGAYAAYLASMRQFTHTVMDPLLGMIGESDTRRIAPQFGAGLVIELESLTFDDPELRERELANDLAARAITKNEWRAVRGRPPVSAEQGGDDWAGNDPAPAVGMYPNAAGPQWPKPPGDATSAQPADPNAAGGEVEADTVPFPAAPKRSVAKSAMLPAEYP